MGILQKIFGKEKELDTKDPDVRARCCRVKSGDLTSEVLLAIHEEDVTREASAYIDEHDLHHVDTETVVRKKTGSLVSTFTGLVKNSAELKTLEIEMPNKQKEEIAAAVKAVTCTICPHKNPFIDCGSEKPVAVVRKAVAEVMAAGDGELINPDD